MRRTWFLAWCLAVACGNGTKSSTPQVEPGVAGTTSGGSGGLIIVTPVGCAGSASGDATAAAAGAAAVDPLCGEVTASVSYQRQVAPLVSCTGEVCHQPWSYDTLVGKASHACCDQRLLVDPGRPSSSHLVQAVTGSPDSCVGRMGSLRDGQAQLIIDWICQGAPNN